MAHRVVLYEKIGPGEHPCHWCGEILRWVVGRRNAKGTLTVDHLDGNKLNNNPRNLVASCHRCNLRRTSPHIVSDEEPHVVAGEWRRRAAEYVCEYCGETFMAPKNRNPVPRFCSLSHARHATAGKQQIGDDQLFVVRHVKGRRPTRRRAEERRCERCKGIFLAEPSRRQRFCTPECARA